MDFGLWMSYPQGSTRGRFRFVGYSNDFHPHKLIFRLLDVRKGSPKLAFVNFRPLDGLPARVHQSSHSSIFDLCMACPQGSTKARFYQFSTFEWLARKGPPKIAFINFRPLEGLPARVHQSSLSSIFDLWMACRKSPPKLAFINFRPLDARQGSPKLAFINFRPLDGLPARVHQSSL